MADAALLIAQFFPGHEDCAGKYPSRAQNDRELGLVCSCGTVLGFPQEEPPEPGPFKNEEANRHWNDNARKIAAARARSDGPKDAEPNRAERVQRADDDAQERFDEAQRWVGQPDDGDDRTVAIGWNQVIGGMEQDDEPPTAPGDESQRWVGTRTDDGRVVAVAQDAEPLTAPDDEAQSNFLRRLGDPGGSMDGSGEDPQNVHSEPSHDEPAYSEPARSTVIVPTNSAVAPQDPIVSAVPVIDPTQVYTPLDVEHQILDVEQRLDRGEHFLRVWLDKQAHAEHAYTIGQARAFTLASGTVDARKAKATLDTEGELWAKTEADMMVRAVRDTLHSLRSQLSGYQTVSRSINVSVNNTRG